MGLNKRIKISKTGIVLLTVAVIAISKIVQINFLPEKYFYDSKGILSIINNPNAVGYLDTSFQFTTTLFRKLNIFGFSTLLQWGLAITVIFGSILCIYVKKEYKQPDTLNFFYFVSSIFLMGIYVFNISKDIIQLMVFFLIYFFVSGKLIKGNGAKLLVCCGVFALESVTFRNYYILLVAFLPFIYFLLNHKRTKIKGKRCKRINLFFFGLSIIIILFVFLNFAEKYFPREYKSLVFVRSNINFVRENSLDAVTIISDVIDTNGNLFTWFLNYIINAIRMLFPLELLFKGIKYTPYVAYQLVVTYYLLHALVNSNNLSPQLRIMVSIITAFFLVSFMFEPDFGSWIRHETGCLPIMLPIVVCKCDRKKAHYRY